MSGQKRASSWWTHPQVLIPALAALAAGGFWLRAGPPEVGPPPDLRTEPSDPRAAEVREVMVYLVSDGVAQPSLREVADASDPSAALQAVVDALYEVLVGAEAWPAGVARPSVFVLEIGRERAAVLDLRGGEVSLGVASELTVLGSLERTLLEQGIDRIAYLRNGEPTDSWLGNLQTDATLE